jgi:hypothetical protein
MFWILNTQLLRREGAFESLLQSLERQDTRYAEVKKIPFTLDLDVEIETDDPKIFCSGSSSMREVCDARGWNPGYIQTATYDVALDNWGNAMLNYGAVVSRYDEVTAIADEFFIRPVEDTKSFSGLVVSRDSWQTEIAEANPYSNIAPDDLVVVAPLTEIQAEYRLMVIGGEIATGSMYRLGRRVVYDSYIEPGVRGFAEKRIKEFSPAIAYALDIASTPSGYRIIETNSISSAGFYACDMGRFVAGINSL